MTKTMTLLGMLLLMPAAFACDYPGPPKNLPDGSTSSKDEMIAGVKEIAVYQESMTSYLECIEADEVVAVNALGDDDDEARTQRKQMFDKKYNAAVDEQTKTVEQFNAEIREFKSRGE